MLNPALPTINQGDHTPLFRLPYELRYRIYQYILTPAHIHVERKVDYELTIDGIKVINTKRPQTSITTSQGQSSVSASQDQNGDPIRNVNSIVPEEMGNPYGVQSGDSDDEDESYQEVDAGVGIWDCSKLYPDSNSEEFLSIKSPNTVGGITQWQALKKIFRIYYCRSQRQGGPSAVPPGFLDHQGCGHEEQQTEFEGSPLAGFRATCQWAYNEAFANTPTATPNVSSKTGLDGVGERLELSSHVLHFSDTKDLAGFTGLVSQEMSESIHSLAVHIPSLNNEYWPYFCHIYLQPWSRIGLLDWLSDPADKVAAIGFYHNHTTHDLADPTSAEGSEDRRELTEALASDWVVPNIYVQSPGSCWSTKFSMTALHQRGGGPLDLRLSFPLFLRRTQFRSGTVSNPEPDHHPESYRYKQDWFDSRRWLTEKQKEWPISRMERIEMSRLTLHGDSDRNHSAKKTSLPIAQQLPQPGGRDCMCEMEQKLCSKTAEMDQMLVLKTWLNAHEGLGHKKWPSKLRQFENLFHRTFLRKRRDTPGYGELLCNIHPAMVHLDECQGLESLEIDFFGDAASPGTVGWVNSTGTSLLRDGLVERFTGKGWHQHDSLDDPVSVFWDVGPHPEPNFVGWADPNNNMDNMNMDEQWRW